MMCVVCYALCVSLFRAMKFLVYISQLLVGDICIDPSSRSSCRMRTRFTTGRESISFLTVVLPMYLFKLSVRDMCIDLRGCDIGVAEHHLHAPDIGAV